jgi:muconolactone delta-isomerase
VSPSAYERRKEIYKAQVERWQAREGEESEHRRQVGQVAIWLLRSPDDAETFTSDHQEELREVLAPLLRDKELDIDAPVMALEPNGSVYGYYGQLIIALASIASPIVTHVLVAWLQRKPGRKVRVEFHPGGEVETVEAQTEEQVLSLVKALDQEARPKASKAKKK